MGLGLSGVQISSVELLHEVDESDFFELAWAYLVKVNSQNVRHVEAESNLNRTRVGDLSPAPDHRYHIIN